MSHRVKRGDLKTLRWNLGRDLTGVTRARVVIAPHPGAAPILDRDGVVEEPPTSGLVGLELLAGDYGPGKLEPRSAHYVVEVETWPGPLTHPDDGHQYERLYVWADLGT
jgi:hypothetical protein